MENSKTHDTTTTATRVPEDVSRKTMPGTAAHKAAVTPGLSSPHVKSVKRPSHKAEYKRDHMTGTGSSQAPFGMK